MVLLPRKIAWAGLLFGITGSGVDAGDVPKNHDEFTFGALEVGVVVAPTFHSPR
jgi:hypothetical protein